MKEIQLDTHQQQDLVTYLNIKVDEPVVFLPPKPKTVKLSELPDYSKVKARGYIWYVANGELFQMSNADRTWPDKFKAFDHIKDTMELIESPKQVWEGGECPVPDGVVVRVGLRNGKWKEVVSQSIGWKHSNPPDGGDIIWYQILRLADGWELVK